jgi:hypothetical protein
MYWYRLQIKWDLKKLLGPAINMWKDREDINMKPTKEVGG